MHLLHQQHRHHQYRCFCCKPSHCTPLLETVRGMTTATETSSSSHYHHHHHCYYPCFVFCQAWHFGTSNGNLYTIPGGGQRDGNSDKNLLIITSQRHYALFVCCNTFHLFSTVIYLYPSWRRSEGRQPWRRLHRPHQHQHHQCQHACFVYCNTFHLFPTVTCTPLLETVRETTTVTETRC